MNTGSNLHLAVSGLRHARLRIFINGQRHASSSVALQQWTDLINAPFAIFQIDTVHNASTTSALQRGLDDVCLRTVHHKWRIDVLDIAACHLGHIADAVATNKVHAHIQEMTAIAHLFLGHADKSIPIIGIQQCLKFLTAVGIGALSNNQETIVLPELGETIEA